MPGEYGSAVQKATALDGQSIFSWQIPQLTSWQFVLFLAFLDISREKNGGKEADESNKTGQGLRENFALAMPSCDQLPI